MKLNIAMAEQLLESRGWSEVMFARKLGLDYTYIYRVMRGARNIGKKFLANFMKLCEREGLNFRDYVELD